MQPRVLILGGGFGGALFAQYLEKRLPPEDADITLIDRNNYFNFYPLLVEAGTGSLEPRHTVVSIRKFISRSTFISGEITGGDTRNNTIEYLVTGTDTTRSISYDHLVVALGSVTNLPPIPGLKDYGYQLKSLTDAVALRDRAIRLLEQANATPDADERKALLHLVVVGANFNGVEVAGEFETFFKEASRMYENVQEHECSVTLVEIAERILLAIDEDLAQYAQNQLIKRDVQIKLNSQISEIHDGYAVLKSGEQLSTHTVVWCAGIAPNPLVEKLDLPTGKRGYIICEKDMRVSGYQDIWGIGDSAVNLDPDGTPYPPTAQHAVAQARFLADNFRRLIHEKPIKDYIHKTRGQLSPLGCRTAVAKIFGMKLSGFPAWFIWRTVYLFKMPGIGRKIQIASDWAMSLIFKREYVQLGVHK